MGKPKKKGFRIVVSKSTGKYLTASAEQGQNSRTKLLVTQLVSH